MKKPPLPKSLAGRLAIGLVMFGAVFALFWWRGPSFRAIGDAFTSVVWQWVAVAIAINLLSVVVRALAWRTVIRNAIDPPHPSVMTVFSAFSVGLFANAVLPGRIGELARVAVLVRKMPRRKGLWATLVGTVLAHRVFDIVPVILLVLFVVSTAKVPAWAISIILAVVGIGIGLFAFTIISARTDHGTALDGAGAVRRLATMARQGLGVMRTPAGAALAASFQIAGWTCQLFAVWTAMRAFHIHAPLPAAGVVLLVMNVVTIFPFWPGNVGAVQLAIAAPLSASYGVAYATGVAYGFGLQAIEASVGIGVGVLFLAREGLSVAMLRVMPSAAQTELRDVSQENGDRAEPEAARMSG
ncbi:MAG TPA: lysylphosphatidylglycerol synthase transmembrane domain-containing protein [Gaiellaceae bacterium]|nr:lysylphosphatidylglycerol synthase transmembrane domain-containing protein [Gaiellaceae bacterium]